jgi:hypothetical protein
MAKLTYLQLVNRVLTRITQAELSSGVSSATGQAKIISNLLNEAQNELWTEANNWHTLFKLRTFSTVTYTASTIAFNNANPDTITDTANGLGSFSAGQTIVISGSTSNDGVYVIATAVAGTITLQSVDVLTAEALGDSVTIYAVSYPVATDWGRTHSLVDFTSGTLLTEGMLRSFVADDPDMSNFNQPYCFSLVDSFYHFHFIPNGTYKIVERYWSVPTAMSADSDTSSLPEFCDNFLIHWAWMSILMYLQKYEASDRVGLKIYGSAGMKDKGILQKCKSANDKIIDQMFRFGGNAVNVGIAPPRLSSHYERYY